MKHDGNLMGNRGRAENLLKRMDYDYDGKISLGDLEAFLSEKSSSSVCNKYSAVRE